MAQDATVAREGAQRTQQHQPKTETNGRPRRAQRVAVAGKSPPPRVRGAQTREGAWAKSSRKSLRSYRWWRNPRGAWEWRVSRLQRSLRISPKLLPRVPASQASKKSPSPRRGPLRSPPPPLINARPRPPPRLPRSPKSLSKRTLHRRTPRGMTAYPRLHRRPSIRTASGPLCAFSLQWKRKSCCLHWVTQRSGTPLGSLSNRFYS